MTDYTPEPERLKQDLHYIREYWVPRNELVETTRRYLSGRNVIEAPTRVRYKIKPVHTYVLASVVNEKTARFMSLPGLQVVVSDALDPEERAISSKIERALSAIQYDMELKGDGDVWGRVTLDAILLDCGVERIDRAPQSFWPELAQMQASGASDELRAGYKKERGSPLRSTYIPLEYTFPEYDGSVIINNFEIEQRNLRAIVNNPSFDSEGIAELKSRDDNGKVRDILILHHSTQNHHALYAIVPSSGGYTNQVRNDQERVWQTTGELVFLHSYEHSLGEVIYNYVSGRFGGWKTSEGGIIDIGKGIVHLNGILDELATQIYTNIRATKWPAFKATLDSEKRGYQEKGPPKAPTMEEGQDVTLFVGEDLVPLFAPVEDPVTSWFFNMVQGQISRLGGNPSLFGESQPGVRTGYQQALQIAEAEGVDAKLEQHMAQGAIKRGTLIMKHVRALDEEVWSHEITKVRGKKFGNYIVMKPEWLSPLPRLDSKVRKPRPVDFLAALRASREASDDRNGKGALLSDITIREEILAREEPDIEEKLVLTESTKNQVIQTGILAQRVGDALNIKLAKEMAPAVDPNMLANIDPAAMQAIQQIAQQSVGQGGINPNLLARTNAQGNTTGVLTPGTVPGESQPEQRLGEEVNASQATGLIQS